MANDFYKKATPSINFFGDSSTFGTEANMRQEMINLLEGRYPEIAKAQVGLLRKMRRDVNNKLIPCPCTDKITGEPDKDRFCGICMSEGFIWDEREIEFYRVPINLDRSNAILDKLVEPGLINKPLVVFYTRYDSTITKEDKMVRLELELDGSRSEPLQRHSIYKIGVLWDYRADNGKLEYYKIFSHEEYVKYLNAPVYSEV